MVPRPDSAWQINVGFGGASKWFEDVLGRGLSGKEVEPWTGVDGRMGVAGWKSARHRVVAGAALAAQAGRSPIRKRVEEET
jgi:hypothetical protein